MEWRPIKTAPMEGTVVLLAVPKIESYDVGGFVPWSQINVIIGWWAGARWEGCFGETHDSGCPTCGSWFEYPHVHPTHWMPLPASPIESE